MIGKDIHDKLEFDEDCDIMKRLFAIVLVMILIVSMCSCIDSKLPTDENKQPQSEKNNEEICEHIWDGGIEVEGGTDAYLMEYKCTVCGEKEQHIITIIPPYPITEDDIVNKVYVYEKEGFSGDFTIEIKADGTFTYYEGMLSSHIGSGEWTYTDTDRMLTLFEKMVRLDENGNWEQFTQSYSFWVEEDTLIFVNKGSDNGLGNFLYVKVKDGEKFFAR